MGWFTYALPQPQENITQYCITEEASGGMGRIGHINSYNGSKVYHVIHKDGHENAMKVIPSWDKKTEEEKARIMGEITTLQIVEIRRHKNIPKLRDHFIVKGNVEKHLYGEKYVHVPYVPQPQRPKPAAAPEAESEAEDKVCGESYCLVYELFRTGTLADEIAKRKADKEPFNEEDVWKKMAELSHAIGKMHWETPRNVPTLLHRNIMPSNIWFHTYGHCMLGDFTVAGPANEKVEFSEKEQGINKMMYWPPERWEGDLVDDKCDVYMLGAVLYEIMALRPAFGGEDVSVMKLMKTITSEAPEPLATACTQKYSRELQMLVQFMLHKDPKVRPSILEAYSCLHVLAPEMSEVMFRKFKRHMSWGIDLFPVTIGKMMTRLGEPIVMVDPITLPESANESVLKAITAQVEGKGAKGKVEAEKEVASKF